MKVFIPRYSGPLFILPEILAEIGGRYKFETTEKEIIVSGLNHHNALRICEYIDSNSTDEDRNGQRTLCA